MAKPARTAVLTPAQRAAVIITVLGDAAAKPIVDKLDNVALAKVAAALENISFIPREQMVEVVIDFLTQLRDATGSLRGGKDKARAVLSSVVDANRLTSIFGGRAVEVARVEAVEPATDTWGQFARRNPKQIADYLGGLTPNIAALILRKLDVSIASDVLNGMDGETLPQIMEFMIDSDQVDPGVEQVLGRMVEMEFMKADKVEISESSEHLEAIGELLSLIPSDKRESLVKFLEGKHDDKLKDIQKSLFTIESLPVILPKAAVPVVVREMDAAALLKLLASLRGKHAAVSEFLLASISARMADQMRDDLKDVKDLSALEAEAVQREFLTSLMAMKRNGLITLEKPPAATS